MSVESTGCIMMGMLQKLRRRLSSRLTGSKKTETSGNISQQNRDVDSLRKVKKPKKHVR